MPLGLMYFARVDGPGVSFDPEIHAVEDLVIFEASVSQARGECAIISLTAEYPESGLLSGSMWGILSIEHDGEIKEIARGQITGFPLALAGQTVSIELMCRRSDHVKRVDNLLATRNGDVPPELMDMSIERRAESYILDDVYHDRRSLLPTLEPIAGDAAPALTLYGEGSAAGASQILNMNLLFNSTPVSAVTISVEAYFEEIAWGKINAAAPFDQQDPIRQATYTPESLRSALQAVAMDGGYELLGSQLETVELAEAVTVYTSARSVDPITCAITKAASVEKKKHRIDDMNLDCAVQALQPRREIMSVTVNTGIGDFSGRTEAIEETLYITDAEKRARTSRIISYKTGRYTIRHVARRGVSASIFSSGGEFRAGCADIVSAVARYAGRIAMERAHCVWLRIDVPAEHIIDLDLRDRVRVVDTRLPGGSVTGKVIGWDIQIGASCPGQLVIMCPISTGTGNAAVLDTSDISISNEVQIVNTDALRAVKNDDAMSLVTAFSMIDAAPEQEAAIGGTTETSPIENPDSALPRTGVAIELMDLTPVDYDDLEPTEVEIEPFQLILPAGIAI